MSSPGNVPEGATNPSWGEGRAEKHQETLNEEQPQEEDG